MRLENKAPDLPEWDRNGQKVSRQEEDGRDTLNSYSRPSGDGQFKDVDLHTPLIPVLGRNYRRVSRTL